MPWLTAIRATSCEVAWATIALAISSVMSITS